MVVLKGKANSVSILKAKISLTLSSVRRPFKYPDIESNSACPTCHLGADSLLRLSSIMPSGTALWLVVLDTFARTGLGKDCLLPKFDTEDELRAMLLMSTDCNLHADKRASTCRN